MVQQIVSDPGAGDQAGSVVKGPADAGFAHHNQLLVIVATHPQVQCIGPRFGIAPIIDVRVVGAQIRDNRGDTTEVNGTRYPETKMTGIAVISGPRCTIHEADVPGPPVMVDACVRLPVDLHGGHRVQRMAAIENGLVGIDLGVIAGRCVPAIHVGIHIGEGKAEAGIATNAAVDAAHQPVADRVITTHAIARPLSCPAANRLHPEVLGNREAVAGRQADKTRLTCLDHLTGGLERTDGDVGNAGDHQWQGFGYRIADLLLSGELAKGSDHIGDVVAGCANTGDEICSEPAPPRHRCRGRCCRRFPQHCPPCVRLGRWNCR